MRASLDPCIMLNPVISRRSARWTAALALCAFLLATAATPLYAQDTRAITFDEAVQIALRQNNTLRQSANFVEQQQTIVSDRRMTFLPNLSLSSGAGQRFGRSVDPLENRIVNEATESFDASISSSVNLFNGFRDVASLEQAKYDLAANELNYERNQQTVVFQVSSNFLTLIQRKEQVSIQEENLASQRQQLAQIEEFVRVGSRPISDLYQQQAAVANSELLLLNAQRDVQLSQVNLIQLLQLDPFGSYTFVSPSIDDMTFDPREYQLGELLQSAFERRPDLEAQEASIAAAEQGIRIARSSILPRVSFSLGYGTGWSSAGVNPLTGQSEDFFDQLDNKRGGSFSFNLSTPLFDRFNTRNSTQRARIQYNNARLDLETVRHDVALQVRQAYLDYLTAEKQLDVAAVQLRSAELALEAAQERYNVGAGNIVELTQAQASYVQAASDQVQARYNFLFRSRLIDYYVGVLEPGQPLLQ